MGSSASKPSRKFVKTLKGEHLNKLKKNIGNDHLKSTLNNTDEPHVFTKRPPKEMEQMGDADFFSGKNTLFEEAVLKGMVNVKDTKIQQNYDPNHESVRVLKNRSTIENQYKGLYVPKDADQPNIPARFLNEQEKKDYQDPEIRKRRLQKTGINSWGLIEAKSLTDLIIDYKVFGHENLIREAKKIDVNEANITRFKALIDSGMLTLPTHKVTLQENIDPESRQVKQKLVTVKDDWVNTIKEDLKKEKINNHESKPTSKKDREIFEQFKMLESLVSKSQITTKPVDGLTEETETVLNRPKKKLVKEVTKML
ncbi:hypothetical protein CANINC_003644 [Pichia inconspicua]|uniref:Uncharacterized protein n=1 Tax=Pichia inconspicua TaxID=52247 RepID=A0A4T0WZL6_9ASCO|nr:hypothetical protein CANINC_003644 [[Candida] inconspicua]